MSKKHIQWLKSELSKLTDQEVISIETSEKLQQHYAMDDLSSETYLLVAYWLAAVLFLFLPITGRI